MKTFKIEIQETLARVVSVKADDIYAAIDKVNDKYKRCEIVLDYNDFMQVDFIDINKQSKEDEKNNLIKDVIKYMLESEKKHFEEQENKLSGHIYLKLMRLQELS